MRGRDVFFEFSVELWPDVEATLLARGYELQYEGRLMIHDRSFVANSAATEVLSHHLPEFWEAGAAAFGSKTRDATETAIASYLQRLRNNEAWAAVVEADGKIVSVGEANGSLVAAEVAGVGTLEHYRRRGYASQVVLRLLADYYASGGQTIWLTAADEPEQRIYSRLGFTPAARAVGYLKRLIDR